ncbi:MAG: hypothetical protein AAGA93_02260 [Actinomycetota bacterium]
MPRIDWAAIRTAAIGGSAVIVAGALLSAVLRNRDAGWVSWLLLLVAIAGFGFAGLLAGRRRRDTPVLHGAIGAGLTFVVAVLIGVAVTTVDDRSIQPSALPVSAVAAVTAGVAGALLADASARRLERRRHR